MPLEILIIALAYIAIMAIVSRMAGGGLGAAWLNKKGAVDDATGQDKGGVMPFNLSWLPEAAFGLGMAFPFFFLYLKTGFHWLFIPAGIAFPWCWGWMETGHGAALQWGHDPQDAVVKKHTLSPVVDWMARKMGFQIGGKNYCRLFMAVKGFLIGLPFGGGVLAVLWPLAYEVKDWLLGRVPFKPHALAELLAGAFAAAAGIIFVLVFMWILR